MKIKKIVDLLRVIWFDYICEKYGLILFWISVYTVGIGGVLCEIYQHKTHEKIHASHSDIVANHKKVEGYYGSTLPVSTYARYCKKCKAYFKYYKIEK